MKKEEMNLINNERRCKFLPEAVIPEGIVCYNDYASALVAYTNSAFTTIKYF